LLHASDGESGRAPQSCLGERDRRLLHVREQTFGRALTLTPNAMRRTPEFSLTTDSIRFPCRAASNGRLRVDEVEWAFAPTAMT
jgi:hypothetical protein